MNELSIRQSTIEEGEPFKNWLLEPDVLKYFPMYDVREIDDSVRIWSIFCKKGASLTAFWAETICGIAFLNLQGYKKFEHQSLITVIVDEAFRNKGVGTAMIEELCKLAKEKFQIEILHLEVYENNPAVNLYRRLGFKEFGTQKHFIKEKGTYIGKILMQRRL